MDPDLVELGDILLTTGRDPASAIIRTFTGGGPFSHALLCTSPGMFVEAMPDGVKRFHARCVEIQDPSTIALLRSGSEYGRAIARRAAVEGEKLRSRPYNLNALTSMYPWFPIWMIRLYHWPFPALRGIDGTGVFCAELVALAYERAGQPLFGEMPASKITPNRLFDLTKQGFNDITKFAICLADYEIVRSQGEALRDQRLRKDLAIRDDGEVRDNLRRLNARVPETIFDVFEVLGKTQDALLDAAIVRALENQTYEVSLQILDAVVPVILQDDERIACIARAKNWDSTEVKTHMQILQNKIKLTTRSLEESSIDRDNYRNCVQDFPDLLTFQHLLRSAQAKVQFYENDLGRLNRAALSLRAYSLSLE